MQVHHLLRSLGTFHLSDNANVNIACVRRPAILLKCFFIFSLLSFFLPVFFPFSLFFFFSSFTTFTSEMLNKLFCDKDSRRLSCYLISACHYGRNTAPILQLNKFLITGCVKSFQKALDM
jgi:hypothetical protein